MQGTNNCILGKTSFWPALACSYNAVVKTKLLILMGTEHMDAELVRFSFFDGKVY